MMDKATDAAAVSTAITAPAWAPYLSQVVNPVLTAISLVLGIAFVLWRWHRGAGKGGD